MATFPFLSKNDSPLPDSAKITVKRQPKVYGLDDMAADIAPKVPGHSVAEIKEVLQTIHHRIIDTLLSGKNVRMPDGSIYSLDADGHTIIIYPPEEEKA